MPASLKAARMAFSGPVFFERILLMTALMAGSTDTGALPSRMYFRATIPFPTKVGLEEPPTDNEDLQGPELYTLSPLARMKHGAAHDLRGVQKRAAAPAPEGIIAHCQFTLPHELDTAIHRRPF